MIDLTSSVWAQGDAVGLVVVVVMLILMGRLVPRRTLEDLRHDKDIQIDALRDELKVWRQAVEHSEAAREALRQQSDENLELARTAVQLLRALPPASGREVTAGALVETTRHIAAPPDA